MNLPVMNAPVQGESNKLPTTNLSPGNHPARLYRIIDMGTQYNSHFNKWQHEIDLVFEFPDHKQIFYEGEQPRPTVLSRSFNLSMHKNAKLRDFVQKATGVMMTDDQAENYNVYELLGKNYMIQVSHSVPKSDGTIYDNIVGVAPFNPTYAGNVDMTSDNEIFAYHMASMGFNTEPFSKVAVWRRNNIMKSQEAQEHQKGGGQFIEAIKREDVAGAGAIAPPVPGASTPNPATKLVMNDPSADYQAFIDAGWTDDLLVQHGHAKRLTEVAKPTPPPVQQTIVPPVQQNVVTPNVQSLQGDVSTDDLKGMSI